MMYQPERFTRTITRHEFKVESQYDAQHHATVRDVTDTIHVALAALKGVRGDKAAGYDDALHVYAADDGVVFYFEVDGGA